MFTNKEALRNMFQATDIVSFKVIQDCNQAGSYLRYKWTNAGERYQFIGDNPMTDERVNCIDVRDDQLYHFDGVAFRATVLGRYDLRFERITSNLL